MKRVQDNCPLKFTSDSKTQLTEDPVMKIMN